MKREAICPVRVLREAIELVNSIPPDDSELDERVGNNVYELLDLVHWFEAQNITKITPK